jgi:hypothetical protein
MSTQPDRELPYEVIHVGGEAVAIVPLPELRRLRALERIASPDELAEAEGAARAEELDALEEAGQTGEMPPEEARRILGIPARQHAERLVPADEVRQLLGMPR